MAEEAKTSEQKAADAGEPAPTAEPEPEAKPKPAPAKKKASKKKSAKKSAKKPNGPTTFLSADDILQKQDIKEEELYIAEWEGSVVVRGLTSVAHEKLVQSAMTGPMGARSFNMVGYQAKVCVLCAYDNFTEKGGKRIFMDAHVPMLQEKASGPVSTIAQKAQMLSGIGTEALDKLRANLELTPSDDSLSG